MNWTLTTLPVPFTRYWKDNMDGVPVPLAYICEPLHALIGREPLAPPDGDFRWHLSLSTDIRVPRWEELVTAAHDLRPGVPFAIGVPPKSWWINVHPHTLHLWEVRDDNLVNQWKREARGDKPT